MNASLPTAAPEAARLDPREAVFRIAGPHPGRALFLRHLPPPTPQNGAARKIVLYVHGATFPSALSIAHRFDGCAWRDVLSEAGYDVWGLDFAGFGWSDRPPEMAEPANHHAPLGRAEDASRQIEAAVRFILDRHGAAALSIIAHSWGTIAAGRFAARRPELVDRFVLFGPIARRQTLAAVPALPAWREITVQEQWDRFVEDVPAGAAAVLDKRHFRDWSQRYLDADEASRTRTPASVRTPAGPAHDIAAAWAGDLAYDPASVRASIAIIRGEWDGLCTDADARWLFNAFANAQLKRDIKIGRATHLMHLEASRYALWRESLAFLDGGDAPPAAERAGSRA